MKRGDICDECGGIYPDTGNCFLECWYVPGEHFHAQDCLRALGISKDDPVKIMQGHRNALESYDEQCFKFIQWCERRIEDNCLNIKDLHRPKDYIEMCKNVFESIMKYENPPSRTILSEKQSLEELDSGQLTDKAD